ncbi:MAG TPA: hypothetical protein DHV68_04505 [Dehalococcoidia bacterium]|nr:hypothetical protein [Chloroflexota bacterium]HCI86087.1 hypothetical protein [Dehalococcoidia bacterium]
MSHDAGESFCLFAERHCWIHNGIAVDLATGKQRPALFENTKLTPICMTPFRIAYSLHPTHLTPLLLALNLFDKREV